MRYLFFSDAHGNAEAVETMLKMSAELNVDRIIFCGDVFGYFWDTEKVIDLLITNKIQCIQGNHDANYLRALVDNEYRTEMVEKYGTSYAKQISEEYVSWIKHLPTNLILEDEDARIFVTHGSFQDYLNGRIYPDVNVQELEIPTEYDYLIMGHTHYRLCLKQGNVCMLNPGSIGQPRDGKGCGFAIVDTTRKEESFYRVEVDREKIRKQIDKEEVYSNRNKEYLYKKLEEM